MSFFFKKKSMFLFCRYWLKGLRKGKSEVFIAGLPGAPDNIRARKQGGYYISIILPKLPGDFSMFESVCKFPALRRFVVRVLFGLKTVTNMINKIVPNIYCTKFAYGVSNILICISYI